MITAGNNRTWLNFTTPSDKCLVMRIKAYFTFTSYSRGEIGAVAEMRNQYAQVNTFKNSCWDLAGHEMWNTSNKKRPEFSALTVGFAPVHFITHAAVSLDKLQRHSLACGATFRLAASEIGNQRNKQYKSLFIEAALQRYSMHRFTGSELQRHTNLLWKGACTKSFFVNTTPWTHIHRGESLKI